MFALCGPASLVCNSCLCTSCFNCVSKVSGQSEHRSRILGYLFIFGLYYGLGILIMYTFGNTFMGWFEKWITCPNFGKESCFGASLLLRVSLSLLIFYAFMVIMMLPKDDFSYGANKTCWIFKYLFPLVPIVAFFFVSNDFFSGYAIFCIYGGLVYLIFQDLAFNEFFLRFSNSFLLKTNDSWCYTGLYAIFTLACHGLSFLFVALNFTYNFNCKSDKAIVIIGLVIIAINIIITFFKTRNDVNLCSTGMYNAYISYYFYSSVSADMDAGCTTLTSSSGWVLGEIFINLLLVITVFLMMTYGRHFPVFSIEKPSDGDLKPEFFSNPELRNTSVTHEANALKGDEDAMDHLEYRTMKYVWLFLCFCFLSMHFLSISTNFGTVNIYKAEPWVMYSAQAGYYIKMINAFFASLLYLWILLAPVILRNRTFGYSDNQQTGSTGTIAADPMRPAPLSAK